MSKNIQRKILRRQKIRNAKHLICIPPMDRMKVISLMAAIRDAMEEANEIFPGVPMTSE